jgi:hypothetical protein
MTGGQQRLLQVDVDYNGSSEPQLIRRRWVLAGVGAIAPAPSPGAAAGVRTRTPDRDSARQLSA